MPVFRLSSGYRSCMCFDLSCVLRLVSINSVRLLLIGTMEPFILLTVGLHTLCVMSVLSVTHSVLARPAGGVQHPTVYMLNSICTFLFGAWAGTV